MIDQQNGRFVVTQKMTGDIVGQKGKYSLNKGDIVDEHIDPVTGRKTYVVGCHKVFRVVIPNGTAGKMTPYVPVNERKG